jgi:hypothetical protein
MLGWYPVFLFSGVKNAFVKCFADGSLLLFAVLLLIDVDSEVRKVLESSEKCDLYERLWNKAENCKQLFIFLMFLYVVVRFLFGAYQPGEGGGSGWRLAILGILSVAGYVIALWYAIGAMKMAYGRLVRMARMRGDSHRARALEGAGGVLEEEGHVTVGDGPDWGIFLDKPVCAGAQAKKLLLKETVEGLDSEYAFFLCRGGENSGVWKIPEGGAYPEGQVPQEYSVGEDSEFLKEVVQNEVVVVDRKMGDMVPPALEKIGVTSAMFFGMRLEGKQGVLVVCNSKTPGGKRPFEVSYKRKVAERAQVLAKLIS